MKTTRRAITHSRLAWAKCFGGAWLYQLYLLAGLLSAGTAAAVDWPSYGADAGRRHLTAERLAFPLQAVWSNVPAQPPAYAWSEPGIEMNRLDFDYAFQPVIARSEASERGASSLVFLASSADDCVRALSLATGAPRWRFTAEAPIRFAPQISAGRCYFSADDGYVYCLEALTGKLVWKRRVALNDSQVLGNGRMISRWPCRAGVLVADGIVYVAAGMWPSEGIFIYALNERDGSELWCNDTSGARFMLYPHAGAYAIGGVAPHGYLLASADMLLLPTGRSVPAVYDRKTGRLLYYRAARRSDGGWRITLADDSFYCPLHAERWPMNVPEEQYGPKKGDGLGRFDLATGIINDDLPERHFIIPAGKITYVAGNGAVQALRGKEVIWTAKHPRVFSLARSGNALLVGGSNSVSAFSLADGSVVWRGPVSGEARGMAIADGRLVVATHLGTTVCFAPERAAGAQQSFLPPADPLKAEEVVPKLLNAADLSAHEELLAAFKGIDLGRFTGGYALIVGASNVGIAELLIKHTQLKVIVLDKDPERVQALSAHFLEQTSLYGSRVSAQHLERPGELPHPDFYANLIVVGAPMAGLSGQELYRVLRPSGGVLCFPGLSAQEQKTLMAAANLPPGEFLEPGLDGAASRVVRGKLPGAFDWNSPVANDQRLKWPLELVWFGGPTPAMPLSQHIAVPPIVANGRYFIVGQDELLAVDAYNGTKLWSRAMPGFLWKVGILAADDETIYVHFREACLALDAQTGRPKATYLKDTRGWDKAEGEVRPWEALPAQARSQVPLPVTTAGFDRADPLTDANVVQAYRRTHGCGGIISSATMHFFRSGTYGIYDLEDDSGLRNFSGVRPACSLNMMPALGLLIANEGSGGCVCSYNFRSSFALAPSARRSNEDWAIFYDEGARGVTRKLALNLGAPGDRRDDGGQLWLGLPRPETGLKLDCTLDVIAGLGPERVNADRTAIAGTRAPWIYASGIVGLRRLSLGLEYVGEIVSLATEKAPVIDGVLDDSCWDGQFPLPVKGERASVFLRHDDTNLYLAYSSPAGVDRRGTPEPGKPSISGKDAPVWEGESCEVTLSDQSRVKAVHLGITASGARYDALSREADQFPPLNIPRLKDIKINALSDDWGDQGFRVEGLVEMSGATRESTNFAPSFRLGWDERGLLIFASVRDDVVVEYPAQPAMWIKDSIELFMAESRNSPNRFQLCIGPGADGLQPRARTFFWDRRHSFRTALTAEVAGARTAEGYEVEILLPWSNLSISPKAGGEVALQVMVNDADSENPRNANWFRMAWHPEGHAMFHPRALQHLRLAEAPGAPWVPEWLTSPYKRGLSGKEMDEDREWDGEWQGAARTNEEAFIGELAIPWHTLAQVGLRKDELLIDFSRRGQLTERPQWSFMPVNFRQNAASPTRSYTVRLHFAEFREVKPGTRVFDVRLQNNLVTQNLDIVKQSGGVRQALPLEFRGVLASTNLTLELESTATNFDWTTAPLLNGLELAIEPR